MRLEDLLCSGTLLHARELSDVFNYVCPPLSLSTVSSDATKVVQESTCSTSRKHTGNGSVECSYSLRCLQEQVRQTLLVQVIGNECPSTLTGTTTTTIVQLTIHSHLSRRANSLRISLNREFYYDYQKDVQLGILTNRPVEPWGYSLFST